MNFDHSLDPFLHLDQWVKEAKEKGITDPNAMTLATVGPKKQPTNRVVLYKGLRQEGLSFFTNYEGDKARDIEFNNKVSVNFYWRELSRQIRVQGEVFKLSRAESEAYFKSRARLSQLGAWASFQSREVDSLETMQRRLQEIERSFQGQDIPCPPNWGGYHLIPNYFEFWLAREGRMHERYCYEKSPLLADASNGWRRFMRYP
jgi:pyridoxamine 5'-phosphate oxidase